MNKDYNIVNISPSLQKYTKDLCENFETLISIVFSNPKKNADYKKIRFFKDTTKEDSFFGELFTQTQVFHKIFSQKNLMDYFFANVPNSFKNVIITTTTETIHILSNKKGEINIIKKGTQEINETTKIKNKEKNYILKENIPVPFLVHLGVMTETGKIITSKYDKFRQINRFLEFIEDVIQKDIDTKKTFTVLDFGCGKSYLTFALYHYLVEIRNLTVDITGLDLKTEVIKNCAKLAKQWGYDSLHFSQGRIEDYTEEKKELDLVITLHACDTATDYALDYAVKNNAKNILSVPCCQHEVNSQLKKQCPNPVFEALLKHGIIKERFSALITDVMRAELLEQKGYSVQLMEFIDISHTPKNLLIRAVKSREKKIDSTAYLALKEALGIELTLEKILKIDIKQADNASCFNSKTNDLKMLENRESMNLETDASLIDDTQQ